ncbi:hypothetical protein [Streptomyces sp. Y1]|uniref:Uncharacterized protein n=1 Tax=Streptomyces sp. Y1 TaxID=3238634 RepID=A0AB39TW63_9ACTN
MLDYLGTHRQRQPTVPKDRPQRLLRLLPVSVAETGQNPGGLTPVVGLPLPAPGDRAEQFHGLIHAQGVQHDKEESHPGERFGGDGRAGGDAGEGADPP